MLLNRTLSLFSNIMQKHNLCNGAGKVIKYPLWSGSQTARLSIANFIEELFWEFL